MYVSTAYEIGNTILRKKHKQYYFLPLHYLSYDFSRHGKLYDDADSFWREKDPAGRVHQSTEDSQGEGQVGPAAADHRRQIQVEHADGTRLLRFHLKKTRFLETTMF